MVLASLSTTNTTYSLKDFSYKITTTFVLSSVKEDAPVGTVLARLTLADPDEARAPLSLYVTEGESGLFSVTAALEVVLTASLDRESSPSHSLTVLATDGIFTTTTTVNVVVIDVNGKRKYGILCNEDIKKSCDHPL